MKQIAFQKKEHQLSQKKKSNFENFDGSLDLLDSLLEKLFNGASLIFVYLNRITKCSKEDPNTCCS